MSAMLPGVSATATIRPQPSARQWIFVVLPPRETPTAWLNSPLFHLTPSDAPSHWNCRAQAPQGVAPQQRSRRRCAARLLFGPSAYTDCRWSSPVHIRAARRASVHPSSGREGSGQRTNVTFVRVALGVVIAALGFVVCSDGTQRRQRWFTPGERRLRVRSDYDYPSRGYYACLGGDSCAGHRDGARRL